MGEERVWIFYRLGHQLSSLRIVPASPFVFVHQPDIDEFFGRCQSSLSVPHILVF